MNLIVKSNINRWQGQMAIIQSLINSLVGRGKSIKAAILYTHLRETPTEIKRNYFWVNMHAMCCKLQTYQPSISQVIECIIKANIMAAERISLIQKPVYILQKDMLLLSLWNYLCKHVCRDDQLDKVFRLSRIYDKGLPEDRNSRKDRYKNHNFHHSSSSSPIKFCNFVI